MLLHMPLDYVLNKLLPLLSLDLAYLYGVYTKVVTFLVVLRVDVKDVI